MSDKPEFDPNQPFQVVGKPEFDPNQPHQVVTEDPASASPVTAGATSLINGATGNFAPAIGAMGKTTMDAITGVNGPLAGGSLDDLIDEYRNHRDKLKSDFAKAAAAHPVIAGAGNLVGGATSLGLAGPAAMTDKGMAATGAVMGLGSSNADLTKAASDPSQIVQAGKDAAVGAGTNLIAGKAIQGAGDYLGNALGGTAEKLAVKATGATGSEASRFADNTGRELLDRGIVNFGSSPGDIAENANLAMDKSGSDIGDILKNQLKGTTVDRNTVLNYIKNKIRSLSGDESQAGLVQKLESEMGNIQDRITQETQFSEMPDPINRGTFTNESRFSDLKSLGEELTQRNQRGAAADLARANELGYSPYNDSRIIENSEIPIDQAEQIKRGYQSKVNWKSLDPDVVSNNANTTVSDAYKQAVEDAATKANPDLADKFKADKETYGLLSPVRKAAEKRANTLDQSPLGGLLDMGAVGSGGVVGGFVGGPVGSAVGAVAGLGLKAIRPRLASAAAVSADRLAEIVSASPGAFGKFAPSLSAAVARGSVSLGATDYILQQTNPEYREQREKVFSSGQDQQ